MVVVVGADLDRKAAGLQLLQGVSNG